MALRCGGRRAMATEGVMWSTPIRVCARCGPSDDDRGVGGEHAIPGSKERVKRSRKQAKVSGDAATGGRDDDDEMG